MRTPQQPESCSRRPSFANNAGSAAFVRFGGIGKLTPRALHRGGCFRAGPGNDNCYRFYRTMWARNWITVKVWPPMVIVLVRDLPLPLYLLTEYTTVPVPEPLEPEVMVIQESFATAVHGHPSEEMTDTLPVPPALAKAALAGLREYVHGAWTGLMMRSIGAWTGLMMRSMVPLRLTT